MGQKCGNGAFVTQIRSFGTKNARFCHFFSGQNNFLSHIHPEIAIFASPVKL